MKKFAVTIKEFSYSTQVVSRRTVYALDILDAVKQLRVKSEWCYNDKNLVEWINTRDEWDVPVDDAFLSELICEEDPGVYYAMLAECMEFRFKEI